MTKRNVKYQGLSLPVPVLDKIKEHIADFPEYTSVTDFVRQSIRTKIRMDLRNLRGLQNVENVMGVKAPFDIKSKIKKLEKRLVQLEQKKPGNNNVRF